MTLATAAPSSRGSRGRVLAATLLATLALLGAFGPHAYRWLRGYALYHGRLTLAGRIGDHSFDLPRHALTCAGCHAAPPAEASPQSSLSLDLRQLTKAKSRRGGPTVAYSAESFCALIRTGLDPAAIMIDRAMPRFTMDDADCHALWTFLGGP